MNAGFVGAVPLLKVALHQDARKIAPWVAGISALSASSVLAYTWVFPDAHSRAELAAGVGANPALSIIFGRAGDLLQADGFNAWRAGALGAFFAGVMAILIVVRNSRADEDSGQAELLASAVMGRQARLAVAVLMAFVASVALGVVASILTIACGGGVANSITLAATFTAVGLMSGSIAAVAAQLGSDARAASAIAISILAGFFVVRGYFDASQAADWTDWLTPLGWMQQVRPAAGNNWWPLLLAVVVALVVAVFAFALQGRRDFAMGLIAPRPGPSRGGWAASIWGLALQLNRGPLIAWLLGFAAVGAVFGNLATSVGDVLADNPAMSAMMAAGGATKADLTFQFLVTILRLVGIIAAVFGVQVVLRMYAEESQFRIDPLLAGALRRRTYLASNALLAFAASAAAMAVAGAIIGVVAAQVETTVSADEVMRQALVTIPAVWTLVALALAAVGAWPAARVVGWLGIVLAFALTLLGPLFRLWTWILAISPLWHIPDVTASSPDWSGLAWISLATVAFIMVAFVGFRIRDIL